LEVINFQIFNYRVAHGKPKENDGKGPGKFSKRYKDTKDEL
jgi:hypothetical protein